MGLPGWTTRLLLVAATAAARWRQDRFVLSFCNDPPCDGPPGSCERYLADAAAANFTVVTSWSGADTIAARRRQLAACEALGMPLIACPVPAAATSGALPRANASLWGFLVRDEPTAADFPAVANKSSAIRRADPAALAYVNMGYGTYTNATQLQEFLALMRPQVLSADFYPRFIQSQEHNHTLDFLLTLTTLRAASFQSNASDGGALPLPPLPVWVYVDSFGFNQRTAPPGLAIPDPTEAELRWQVMAALATGASGVLYFCYWTPPGEQFAVYPALAFGPTAGNASTPYTLTKHHGQARRVNSVARAFTTFLFGARSTGLALLRGFDADRGATLRAGGVSVLLDAKPVSSSSSSSSGSSSSSSSGSSSSDGGSSAFDGDGFLVGQFGGAFRSFSTRTGRWHDHVAQLGAGSRSSSRACAGALVNATAVMVQNWNWTDASSAELSFAAPLARVREVSPVHATLLPVVAASAAAGALRVTLDAGAARLFIVLAANTSTC